MCSITPESPPEPSAKKKNKLGYHRQSVACSHCRRRKIRCLPSEVANGKCQNCTRTGKVCHFLKVSEDNVPWPGKKSKGMRCRSFDEHDLPSLGDQLQWQQPTWHRSSETSSFVHSVQGSPSRHTRLPQAFDQLHHSNPEFHDSKIWPPRTSHDHTALHFEQYPSPRQRPTLQHRSTEPIEIARYRGGHIFNDEPMMPTHHISASAATQPTSAYDTFHTTPWPIYATHHSYPVSQAKTSERSSSFDAPQLNDEIHWIQDHNRRSSAQAVSPQNISSWTQHSRYVEIPQVYHHQTWPQDQTHNAFHQGAYESFGKP